MMNVKDNCRLNEDVGESSQQCPGKSFKCDQQATSYSSGNNHKKLNLIASLTASASSSSPSSPLASFPPSEQYHLASTAQSTTNQCNQHYNQCSRDNSDNQTEPLCPTTFDTLPLPCRTSQNNHNSNTWRTYLLERFGLLSSRNAEPNPSGGGGGTTGSISDRVTFRPEHRHEMNEDGGLVGVQDGNDDHNIIAFSSSARHTNSNERPLYCKLRKYLVKIVIIAFIIVVAVAAYQTIHLITHQCQSPSMKHTNSAVINTITTKVLPYQTPLLNNEDQLSELCVDNTGQLFPWKDIRLPSFIKPVHYDLYMDPSMDTFINKGVVEIYIQLEENCTSNFIVLHVKKMSIDSVQVAQVDQLEHGENETKLSVVKTSECIKLEQLYVEVMEVLCDQFYYRLVIHFTQLLDDQLEGFYISKYLNSVTKKRHHLLTTHFQPTMARTAFPCFDEPAMKASFVLKMVHDKAYNVYFNTPLIGTEPTKSNSSRLISEFERTVPMSTYVIGFVVCDFTTITTKSKHGIVIRAVVPTEQESNGRYALESASKVITYFDDFFKIPYPLKKLDLIVVPDFSAGAMENWGIITFRTSTFLYNPDESSLEIQEQVAIVVAHEIAHQWFGNLVTMDWWNDLWLNEGFASFVENLGVNHLHPEWRMLDQFVISVTQQALSMDSLMSSHPINTLVTNPAEIEAIFDMISYKKGSCLIRMLMSFLGLENLKSGLEKYLNRYKFRTAKTNQLWDCFNEVSTQLPHNVSEIMHTWTLQKGYPVVNARWNPDGKSITVEQHPFISSLSPEAFESNRENLSQIWVVPLTIVSNVREEFKLHWLNSTSMQIPLEIEIYQDWFKLNYQQSGFYRVNYDTLVWRNLIRMLVNSKPNQHQLSPSDRAGLIDDALSLMRIGYLNVNTALDLTRYLEFAEFDYVPWETTLNHFAVFDSLMLQHPMLHRYIRRLIKSVVRKLTWEEKPTETVFDKKLRAIMLRAAIYYGDKEAINTSLTYFQQWMTEERKIPANIRDIVYHAGVQFGEDTEWTFCFKKYLNTTLASEKRLLLGALGSPRNQYLLSQYLNASLNRELIRTQDTYYVIMNVARNPIGRELAWKFIRTHWNFIFSLFGQGSFAIDTIISETTWHFFTQFEYDEVEQFFNSVDVGSGKQAVKQNLEKIRSNIYWKNQVENKVIQWLNKV